MIRRGNSRVSNVSSENLITFIRKKILIGTDELSGDGKNWIRVDRHYQLRKYFSGIEKDSAPLKPQDEISSEMANLSSPPYLERNLKDLAELLKDING